jgi:hypothetical protein
MWKFVSCEDAFVLNESSTASRNNRSFDFMVVASGSNPREVAVDEQVWKCAFMAVGVSA